MTEQEKIRREKLEELKKLGINPYPAELFPVNNFSSELIENFDEIKYPHLREAKHLFVFSYYTRGMNYADIMKLTWDNVFDNKIYYNMFLYCA